MTKKEFISKIIQSPKDVTNEIIDSFVLKEKEDENHLQIKDFDHAFRSIYDMNEQDPFGEADSGALGFFNRRSNKKRVKKFKRTIKKNNQVTQIYVEGDSWYQHPLIKEIYDFIWKSLKDKNYAMYPSARGGDWIMRILKEGKYIAELSNISADIILLAGGGNDLVGKQKLSNLITVGNGYLADDFADVNAENVRQAITDHPLLSQWIALKDDEVSGKEIQELLYGLSVFNREFYSVMLLLQTIYKYLIHNIRQKFDSQKIIFHGYDFPIPSYRKGQGLRVKKFVVNAGMSNGHWLAQALDQAKVPVKNQSSVMYSMIYILNELIINSVISNPKFNKRVYFVDARGAAERKENNWYDEMHVKPKVFKKIAERFVDCIEYDQEEPRIFKV